MTTETPVGSFLLNRYEITQEIARGGYGVVFKARDSVTNQTVAVKRLLTDDETQIGRFDREMKLTSKLKNPHTVRLLDFGQHDTSPVMVMEFVEGQSLHHRIERGGPLSPSQSQSVVMQVLESLEEAHSHGIVHRDLKPLNIMLTGTFEQPEVKLLDFGTAGVASGHQDEQHKKITKFGEIQGTPAYMAPEQIINFGEACTQSDIYAVGLILYECLVGQRAVTGRNSLEICSAQVQQPLVLPPHIKEGHFGPIIERACAKATTARYQTAKAFLEDLAALDLSKPPKKAQTPAPSGQPTKRPPASQNPEHSIKQQTMLIAVLILLILCGVIFAVLFF